MPVTNAILQISISVGWRRFQDLGIFWSLNMTVRILICQDGLDVCSTIQVYQITFKGTWLFKPYFSFQTFGLFFPEGVKCTGKEYFPAITPFSSLVWMNKQAECSKNAASLIWSKLPNFMMSLPDSYFVPGSDVIHCRILILYPTMTSFIAGAQRSTFREKSSVGYSLAISGHSSILLPGVQYWGISR